MFVVIYITGKDYEFVFEDQIEFISTEVLKNTLKQKEDNDRDGGDSDVDGNQEDDGVDVSVRGKQDGSILSAVKAKKETAHQKILAGRYIYENWNRHVFWNISCAL